MTKPSEKTLKFLSTITVKLEGVNESNYLNFDIIKKRGRIDINGIAREVSALDDYLWMNDLKEGTRKDDIKKSLIVNNMLKDFPLVLEKLEKIYNELIVECNSYFERPDHDSKFYGVEF